jgi:PPE family/PE-PPE domain
MNFSVMPPEVNSSRMFSGRGSGSMLAAMAAWDALAAELRSAAASFASVTSGLSAQWWQGPSSAAMAGTAAVYAAWLGAVATQAEQAAAQGRVAAGAFETAFIATVHPVAVTANRARLVWLVESNVLGQNASAIAATEAEYEQMWAQDVAAMVGYHGAASVAGSQLMPWQQLTQSVSDQASVSSGETRITVPMNSPLYSPKIVQELEGLTAAQYAALNTEIGENWFPGTIAEVVNYPAAAGLINSITAPTANKSVAIGQQMLNTDILNATANGQSVVVTSLSEGGIVIDAEEAYLATAPNAPAPNQVTFVEFANPQRGLADTYLHAGITIPGVGYTVHDAPVSQYDTDVVYRQYEGFGDPPDRPWHLLADVDAVAGVAYLHIPTEFVSPSQAVEVSSVTNSLGGTTTTYMIPTDTLPILMPLQQIGVPSPIVHGLNNMLTPIVNEGYSQYDPTGGPYFSQGNLVR